MASQFRRCGNRGKESLCDVPQTTQLTRGRPRFEPGWSGPPPACWSCYCQWRGPGRRWAQPTERPSSKVGGLVPARSQWLPPSYDCEGLRGWWEETSTGDRARETRAFTPAPALRRSWLTLNSVALTTAVSFPPESVGWRGSAGWRCCCLFQS